MKSLTSLPYLDQLDQERQEFFRKLKSFANDFVLAGGTATMLQIGHRKSFDFDCFTQDSLPATLTRKVRKVFETSLFPIVDTSEQLMFKTSKNIKITFVSHPYDPLRPPLSTSSISLFHLDDLAANKAYTIGRRGAWRDYVDLFFFLKWNLYDIEKIISLTQKKFAGEFNQKLFLEQLVYFDDLSIIPTEFLKESYSVRQIQSLLSQKVEEYLKKILG